MNRKADEIDCWRDRRPWRLEQTSLKVVSERQFNESQPPGPPSKIETETSKLPSSSLQAVTSKGCPVPLKVYHNPGLVISTPQDDTGTEAPVESSVEPWTLVPSIGTSRAMGQNSFPSVVSNSLYDTEKSPIWLEDPDAPCTYAWYFFPFSPKKDVVTPLPLVHFGSIAELPATHSSEFGQDPSKMLIAESNSLF